MSITPIKNLVELCKIDATISRILSEKKKLESEALKQKTNYMAIAKIANESKEQYESKQKVFKKEENVLKDERDKIADRRKELASLNNYKVQQAAEKELDHSIRQIQLKEESLITEIDQLSLLETKAKEAEQKSTELRKNVEIFLNEAKETMPSLDERLQRQTAERQELLTKINSAFVAQYEKVRQKYPVDAVVSLDNKGGCAGCYMSVGPQVIQKLMKLETIEKCAGCGRILYISEEVITELHL